MAVREEILEANERYGASFTKGDLPMPTRLEKPPAWRFGCRLPRRLGNGRDSNLRVCYGASETACLSRTRAMQVTSAKRRPGGIGRSPFVNDAP